MAQDIELRIKAIVESADASKNIDDLKDALQELESIAENVDLSPDQLNNLGGAIDNLSGKVQQSEASLERFKGGIETVKASGELLAGSISAVVGGLATLGIENEYITNLTQGAAGAIALSSGVGQAGEAIVKLSQNTKIASVAQRAFNIVANANPYLLAVTALVAAGAAIIGIARALDDEAESQRKANEQALASIDLRDKQIAKERDFALALANTSKERLDIVTKSNQDEIENTERRIRNLKKQEADAVREFGSRSDEYKAILADRNAAEEELEKLQNERDKIARDREIFAFNEQLAIFEQREKLLAAQGVSEKTLFDARVATLNETIRLFGAESDEGIRAARELEVVRAQFATNQRTRKQEAVQDNKAEKDSIDAIIEANKRESEDKAELIAQIEALENAFEDSQLSRQEREENAVRDKYFAIIEAARAAGLEIATLEAAQEAELKTIRDAAAADKAATEEEATEKSKALKQTELENEIAVEQAKFDIAGGTFTAIGNLATAFAGNNERAARRAFQINKAASLAEATISTYAAATNVLATAAANPATVLFPGYPALQAGLIIANGLANVATIARTKFESPSTPPPSPSGSLGGGGLTGSAPTTPTFSPQQFFGLGGGTITPNGGGPQDTRVFVVESDITNVQNRVSVIEERSRI